MNGFTAKQPYYFANQPNKAYWLTDKEAELVFSGRHIQSGLPVDVYMSLIDPKYPKCFG